MLRVSVNTCPLLLTVIDWVPETPLLLAETV